MIRITAQRDGFRRCGIAHSAKPVDYPADRFSPAELKILKAETMLTVEEVEGGAANAKPNAKDTIALVTAAATALALDTLAEGEERKSVLDAIAKRRTELSA